MLGAARTAWNANAWGDNLRRTTAAATLGTFTFTGFNGANYTTSISRFGAGSLDVTGNTQSIEYPSWNGPYPSGLGDFCVEGWVWVPSARDNTKTGDPIVNNDTSGLGIRFGRAYRDGGFNYLSLFARRADDLNYAAITWPTDTWVHWAVQRKSAVISFWANGNKLAITGSASALDGGTYNFAAPTNSNLSIGSYDGPFPASDETMRCFIDEVCVSNSWRYNDAYSTYVVPTAAFTVDTITDMLIHFDSSLTTAAT